MPNARIWSARWWIPALASVLAALGCTNGTDANELRLAHADSESGDGGVPSSSMAPGPTEAPPQPLPPCDATETAVLQTTLDGAHPANTDMVAIIKTPSCGIRYFTSGPSKLGATTLHRNGSVAKTYTGAVVLALIEQGLLRLDDPAMRWLDAIPGGDSIRVKHLLQHTSGLAPLSINMSREISPDAILANSFRKPLEFPAGAKFQYQNVNYTALGVIAEKVSGKPFATLLRERILAPLGLEATFFEGDDPIPDNIAATRDMQGRPGAYQLDASAFWGAGNIVAAPGDTLTWIEAFASGRIFKTANLVNSVESVDVDGKGKYGLARQELAPHTTFGAGVGYGHYGDMVSAGNLFVGNSGYHTAAFHFPERKTTVVTVFDYSFTPIPTDDATIIREPFFKVIKTLFGTSKP